MFKFSDRFEKIISGEIIIMAMFFIVCQVVQLIWNTYETFSKRFREVGLTYAPEYGRTIAVMFFNVLLMMEIMQTIKSICIRSYNQSPYYLIVCLIAASRRILELGKKELIVIPVNIYPIHSK